MPLFVEEFLFRGATSEGASAWHVVLANQVDDGFGGTVIVRSGPMPPAKAESLGFPLPIILTAINTAVMDQLAGATTALAQKDVLISDLQTLLDSKNNTIADFQAQAVQSASIMIAKKETPGI